MNDTLHDCGGYGAGFDGHTIGYGYGRAFAYRGGATGGGWGAAWGDDSGNWEDIAGGCYDRDKRGQVPHGVVML